MEFNVRNIENMTEDEVKEIARTSKEINGHTVYFVDFKNAFGYSALVFADGKHIHYANDHELHHRHMSRSELYKWYVKTMSNKLYTEEQLLEPIRDYDDYAARTRFLRNYYPMRRKSESIFGIVHSEKERKAWQKKVKRMFYSDIAFAYFDDPEFVEHMEKLMQGIENRWTEKVDDFDTWKAAFKYEMANHEYIINCYQGDWDTLSAFGNIEWKGEGADVTLYFDQLGFNETQRRAWYAARSEYLKEAEKYL